MYYVYILINNKSRKLYIGYTNNLKRRFKEHKKENDFKLIYYEAYFREKEARHRERGLKFYGSAWRGLKKRLNI